MPGALPMPWSGFEPALIGSVAAHLTIAFVLTLPLAWNRERDRGNAGLRTFAIVAVASCAFALLGRLVLEGNLDAVGRVAAGVITGIGFVGGGAILKSEAGVEGTATAASIWSTGAIGLAVGLGALEVAVVVGLVNLLAFTVLDRLKPLDDG